MDTKQIFFVELRFRLPCRFGRAFYCSDRSVLDSLTLRANSGQNRTMACIRCYRWFKNTAVVRHDNRNVKWQFLTTPQECTLTTYLNLQAPGNASRTVAMKSREPRGITLSVVPSIATPFDASSSSGACMEYRIPECKGVKPK